MGKYCIKCGKKIDDKDVHCQYCGALQDTGFDNNDSDSKKEKKEKDLVVPIVAVCSIILVIIIVIANLFIFNSSYKSPIDKLFEAIESGDADNLEDALPEYYLDSDDYDDDKIENLLNVSSSGIALIYGNDFDISYKITDKESIDNDDLKKLKKSIKKKYDENVDVEKGYRVKGEMTIKSDDTKENEKTKFNIYVYKIDGKWSITEDAIESIF